jgi:hypothetical protein
MEAANLRLGPLIRRYAFPAAGRPYRRQRRLARLVFYRPAPALPPVKLIGVHFSTADITPAALNPVILIFIQSFLRL